MGNRLLRLISSNHPTTTKHSRLHPTAHHLSPASYTSYLQSCRTLTRSPVSSTAPSNLGLALAYLAKTEQFVEYYYKTFDANRAELAPLYVRHRKDCEIFEDKQMS